MSLPAAKKFILYWWKEWSKRSVQSCGQKGFMSIISFSKKKKRLCQILTLGSWTSYWTLFIPNDQAEADLVSSPPRRLFFNQIIPGHRHFIFRFTFGGKTNQFHVFFLNGVSLAKSAWICGFYGFLNLRVNREKAHSPHISGLLFSAGFAFDGDESVSVNSPCPHHSELYMWVHTGFP